MRKNHLVSIFSVLACILLLSTCKPKRPEDAPADRKTQEDTLRVGVAAPFSGQEGVAVYGENIRTAVELAVKHHNDSIEAGGTRIEVVYEDTQLLPEKAIAAVETLMGRREAAVVIGAVGSSSSAQAIPVAERFRKPLVSPASTANSLSGQSEWFFRTIAPDTYEAKVMAAHVKEQGLTSFGILFVDNAGTRGPAVVFKSEVESYGLRIVAEQVIPQGSTDVRTQVTNVLRKSPEAVYVLGYALELGSMVKQIRSQDAKIPIFSFQVMEEVKVREIAGVAAEGVVFTTPTLYEQFATGKQASFVSQYRETFGREPGIFAANAYDAVGVIALCASRFGALPEQIRTGLSQIKGYQGASGTFDIDANGDSNQQPRLMIVANGELHELEGSPVVEQE